MRDYHCPKCHHWLFTSDATHGRLRTYCKTCKASRYIFLGGHQTQQPSAVQPEPVTLTSA